MTTTNTHTRIEMRVDIETKQMAERASAALGCASLTEFITRLIREHAPEILQEQAVIKLTNAQFDHFKVICESDIEPSRALKDAAKRLDQEGY